MGSGGPEDTMIIDRKRACWRQQGMTLMEIVLAVALLGTVMTVAYRILVNVLNTERYVARISAPEKVGQAILNLVRKDLVSVVYRNLGEFVFQVYDNGELPEAADEIQFFTTRDPIALETLGGQLDTGGSDEFSVGLRGITAVSYSLQPNQGTGVAGVYTLFRSEVSEFDLNDPFGSSLSGPRMSYEIYDKVRALSIECFDGREWWPMWESQVRLQEEIEMDEENRLSQRDRGTGEVDNVTAGAPITGATPLEGYFDVEDELLPTAAVPVAVRVTVVILVGDERGAHTDEEGHGEFKEYLYSTIVPILPALRIPLPSDEELAEFEDMLENAMEGRDDDRDDDDMDSDSSTSERGSAPRSSGSGRGGGGSRGSGRDSSR